MNSCRISVFIFCAALGTAPAALGQVSREVTKSVNDSINRNQADRISRSLVANVYKPELKIRNRSGDIRHVGIHPHSQFLTLVMEDDTVRLWDLAAGVQRAQIASPSGSVSFAVPTADGRSVMLGDRKGRVFAVDLEPGKGHTQLGAHRAAVSAMAISSDDRTLVTASAKGRTILWNLEPKQQRVLLEGHSGRIRAIALSRDGANLATGGADRSVRVWAARSGEQLAVFEGLAGEVIELRFIEDGSALVVGTATGQIETLTLASGVRETNLKAPNRGIANLAVNPGGNRVAAAYKDGSVRIFDLTSGMQLRDFSDEDGGGDLLAFLAEGRRLLSGGRKGTLRIWDPTMGDLVLRMITTADGWTVIGRQGRFDGSEVGIGNVSWEADGEDISLDRFSEKYFEPGLLASYLRDDVDLLSSAPAKIEDGITLPPQVLIDSVEKAPDGKLVVVAVAEDRGGGIETIRLYHNGKLAPPSSLLEQKDSWPEKDQHLRAAGFVLDRLEGPNSFKAIATGSLGIESESQRLTEIFEGSQRLGSLHVAAVGINRYNDSNLNLDYSVPDAEAILSRLGEQRTGSYAEVVTHRLLDEQATRDGILDLLGSFRDTAPDDVVVIYFAGHGRAADGEWFFIPYEATYEPESAELAKTSVSGTEIQEALVGAKAQRVLLMIDSCQSGASILSFQRLQRFQRRFLRSLSRIAGVTVLAAARQDQLARERGELGHGLFTHVVLDGLGGRADARPRDGQITAHEIIGYSVETLPTLSRRFYPYQTPQEPMAFALGSDFLLRGPVVSAAPPPN